MGSGIRANQHFDIDLLRGNSGNYANIAPSKGFVIFDDFLSITTDGSDLGWDTTNSGSGSGFQMGGTSQDEKHPGIWTLLTGTTGTGRASLTHYLSTQLPSSYFILTGGSWAMEWVVKSSGSASTDHIFILGMADGSTDANHNEGVYFYRNFGTSSNWIAKTINAGTATETDTGVAVNGGDLWHKLRMEINAAADEVLFFIDGVLVATNTTNIPDNPIQKQGPLILIENTSGTTSRGISIDYLYMHYLLTTER